uniref:Scaffolding protein n=1 Tax=viral metagenome TaxID=1070528 RepID=A0A6M3J691_9ZZZZ
MTTDETKQAVADSSQDGDSSQGKAGSTSQETKTYTEVEVQKMVSDRLAQTGREAKSLEQREAVIRQREEDYQRKQTDEQRRKDEEEYEKARDNPELLNTFQGKKQLREEREALAKERNQIEQDKLAHQVEIESAREIHREVEIWDIAQKYGADPVTLKELNLDIKQTELVAQKIGTKKSETTPKVKHDSGMTIGGGNDLDSLSPREKIERGLEQNKEKLRR